MEVSTLTYNLGNLGFWMCSTGWFKQNCFRSHCSPIVPPPLNGKNLLSSFPFTDRIFPNLVEIDVEGQPSKWLFAAYPTTLRNHNLKRNKIIMHHGSRGNVYIQNIISKNSNVVYMQRCKDDHKKIKNNKNTK